MWLLLDNLGAVLVTGVVLLILIGVQFMSGQTQVESVQRASARPILTQTTDWIERDLNNIGFDVPAGEPAILAYNWAPSAGTFTFVTMSDTTTMAQADTIRYAYTVTAGVHKLERFTNRNGVETRTAQAGPALEGLTIRLRTHDDQPVAADLSQTARIDVSLAVSPPLNPDGRLILWNQEIAPANLIRRFR